MQKHCTKRGNQNGAQQATSGEAAEEQITDQGADDSDHKITDQYEVTALSQHSRQMLTVELTL
jgi:hypothetical protein